MSKPSIPAWQRTSAGNSAAPSGEQEPKPENAAEDSTVPVAETTDMGSTEEDANSTELLEQASRFLEDSNIRDAPREKKVVFLQAKGVSAEDIERLLGKGIQEHAPPDLEAAGARAWSTVSTNSGCCSQASRGLSASSSKKTQLMLSDATQTCRNCVCTATTGSRAAAYCDISRVLGTD